MSEPIKEVVDAVGQSGWAVALLTATWGLVLRILIGRYLRTSDENSKRLAAIEQRLAVIESRSHLRRQGDK
jgi:hypothetical protein